jgi:hypothetical protein
MAANVAPDSPVYFACGKCGERLFDRADVSHEVGRTDDGAADSVSGVKAKWGNAAKAAGVGCTSVFLTEPPVFAAFNQANEGRVNCPNDKCAARVGSYSWSGAPCSCGKWVTPSFQFQRARVDIKGSVTLPQQTVLQQQQVLARPQQLP